MNAWIGVDFDGTLAEYNGWVSAEHIGKPIPVMVDRVKAWLAEGLDVRILTARTEAHGHIMVWCQEHIGRALPITNKKDFGMVELWDDRCVAVEANTGRMLNKSRRFPEIT